MKFGDSSKNSVGGGAGLDVQDLLQGKDLGKDLSGNKILADVGPWLRDELRKAIKVCSAPVCSRPCFCLQTCSPPCCLGSNICASRHTKCHVNLHAMSAAALYYWPFANAGGRCEVH